MSLIACAERLTPPVPLNPCTFAVAQITAVQAAGVCEIEQQYLATVALSSLIKPQVGDTVLLCCQPHQRFITAILARVDSAQSHPCVELGLADAQAQLRLQGHQLHLLASDSVKIDALNDVAVTAASGTLRLTAQHMISTVYASMIQSVKQMISRFGDYSIDVSHLTRWHSRRKLLTAQQEIKIDADIIHMG